MLIILPSIITQHFCIWKRFPIELIPRVCYLYINRQTRVYVCGSITRNTPRCSAAFKVKLFRERQTNPVIKKKFIVNKMSTSKALDLIKCVVQRALQKKGYEQCMKNVEFISADNGNCIAEFTVAKEHLNAGGTLHGGCTSTLIDCVSSYALMTTGEGLPGVSVDLHVTFLKAAHAGEVVKIDARTIKAGKRLAFLAVELSKKSDGVVVARGSHTKYIGASNFKTN